VRTVTIDPLTRLEGHGRIEIFLDDAGRVENAYLQVPEMRGFEQFCVGRLAEDMPALTSRICGLCPEAHLMASAKALDDLFQVAVPRTGRLLRELLYASFYAIDHLTHFYALGGPDLIVGPEAEPAQRSLMGVIGKLGAETGKQVIAFRRRTSEVIELLGGRGVHGTGAVPGGWSKRITEEERETALAAGRANVEFALASLDLFEKVVLKDPQWREVLLGEQYRVRTHSMGTVNAVGRADFFDGTVRVVDPEGVQVVQYPVREYPDHVAEHTEPWTYMTFPYLRERGWQGFTEGAESGVYTVGPLARLNVAEALTTPRAQEHFARYFTFFGAHRPGGRHVPVHQRLATHWARLIEVLNASERMVELALDPEIISPHTRELPSGEINPGGGIGSVEAPRGTLIHHYEADERGVLTSVNMIVGTVNNNAAMSMSIGRAARAYLDEADEVNDGLLNRIEMAMRLYDPCLSCATHSLPGRMPLQVNIRDAAGSLVRELRRDG